jgi:hypothetical protein
MLSMVMRMTLVVAPMYLLSRHSIPRVLKPLHTHVPNPSIEHCVPQSLYNPVQRHALARDMHGLTCIPLGMNQRRSNYQLSDGQGDPKNRTFSPPQLYRGPYARSIGYFLLVYPNYTGLIHTRVLDLDLLVKWSLLHPPKYHDYVAHATIASIQGNANPFFDDSDQARHDILSSVTRTSATAVVDCEHRCRH